MKKNQNQDINDDKFTKTLSAEGKVNNFKIQKNIRSQSIEKRNTKIAIKKINTERCNKQIIKPKIVSEKQNIKNFLILIYLNIYIFHYDSFTS